MSIRQTILALLFLAGTVSTSKAQLPVPVGISPGTKMRVTAPAILPEPITGRLTSLTPDTVSIAKSGAAVFQIPMISVQKLELSEGRNRLKWAALGALAGGLVGGLIGGYSADNNDPTGLEAAALFIAGGTVGLVGGGVAGAVFAPERWYQYSLPRGR